MTKNNFIQKATLQSMAISSFLSLQMLCVEWTRTFSLPQINTRHQKFILHLGAVRGRCGCAFEPNNTQRDSHARFHSPPQKKNVIMSGGGGGEESIYKMRFPTGIEWARPIFEMVRSDKEIRRADGYIRRRFSTRRCAVRVRAATLIPPADAFLSPRHRNKMKKRLVLFMNCLQGFALIWPSAPAPSAKF